MWNFPPVSNAGLYLSRWRLGKSLVQPDEVQVAQTLSRKQAPLWQVTLWRGRQLPATAEEGEKVNKGKSRVRGKAGRRQETRALRSCVGFSARGLTKRWESRSQTQPQGGLHSKKQFWEKVLRKWLTFRFPGILGHMFAPLLAPTPMPKSVPRVTANSEWVGAQSNLRLFNVRN